MSSLKKTPLFDYHFEVGAKMVPIGNWTMPFQFGDGYKLEYLHCFEGSCITDFGCAEIYRMTGSAFALFQKIAPEIAVGHGGFMSWYKDGMLVDTPFAVRMAEDDFLTMFAPSARTECMTHFGQDGVQELSEIFGCVALWGTDAADTLRSLQKDFAFDAADVSCIIEIDGVRCIVCAMTVFKDIPGFMIFCDREKIEDVWIALFNTPGVWACGFGAWDLGRAGEGTPPYNSVRNDLPVGLFKWNGKKLPRSTDKVEWQTEDGVKTVQVIYCSAVPHTDEAFLLVKGDFSAEQVVKWPGDADGEGEFTGIQHGKVQKS